MKRQILSALLLLALCDTHISAQSHQTTLFDSTRVVMEESGLSHVVNHQRIRIEDHTGCKNNNVVKIDYDPQSAYVEFRQVVIHRAGGRSETLLPGKESVVYDYVAPARMIYWGASQKMVEIGHLEPGDEIEVTTYRKGFTYALLADDSRYIPPMKGHFYDIVPFWSKEPVKLKYYSLTLPAAKHLQFHIYNDDADNAMRVDSTSHEGQATYTFVKHDITPLRREPMGVADNDIQCKLLLSTAPDWEAKSRWFYGVNEDYGSFVATPEVKAKVNALIADARDEQDSISILTHWVADNIRYAGISMGDGEGYTLHNAEMNYTDRCGVCKDKAGMLVTMLRAAGFKAYAAMTMAGERIDRIPADQFNHSVCAVQHRDGHYELLDPTWVPNVRELWSSAEQQQGYLMGLPDGADLMYTPVSAPENHYIRINGTSAIDKDGTLTGTLTIEAEGQSDALVRSIFSAPQSLWRHNMEKELLKIAPNAEITNIEYTDNDRYLEQPVRITYTYRIPGFATMSKKEIAFVPLAARNFFNRAMPHVFVNTTPEKRSQPFRDYCSSLIEIKETITLPQEYKTLHFPHIEGVADPAASFGCQYWIEGATLTFAESLVFGKRIYEAGDWPTYRQAVINQNTLATTPVILTK